MSLSKNGFVEYVKVRFYELPLTLSQPKKSFVQQCQALSAMEQKLASYLHDEETQNSHDYDVNVEMKDSKINTSPLIETNIMDNSTATTDKTENKKKKKKGWKEKWKKRLMYTFNVFLRSLSLTDFVTDIILLYKVTSNGTNDKKILPISIILFLSIVSPYIISYSSGVKLFLFRRTFEDLKGFLQIGIVLYLLPTGVLYFVFLDILDVFLNIYRWILFIVFQWSLLQIKKLEETLAQQVGMDRMNWECMFCFVLFCLWLVFKFCIMCCLVFLSKNVSFQKAEISITTHV